MVDDIAEILKGWPGGGNQGIRRVVDAAGAEKIQIRVDRGAFQGILQMELEGRPDGQRPHNCEYAFDYFRNLSRDEAGREGKGYFLTHQDCEEIFAEGYRIYERYLFLLQLEDYDRVIRDTERNMELFRFVNRYAEEAEDREHLERWWPYILRIHATARVMIASRAGDHEGALKLIAEVAAKIENLPEVDADEFRVEQRRSLKALSQMAEDIRKEKPLSETEALKRELDAAVAREEYEKAAELRDRLREAGKDKSD